jgi:uncharacterized delta-60 repeat protein
MKANYRSIILAVSVFFALSVSTSAAPGDLDPTFGNGGIVISTGGSISTLEAARGMALQADGKIVAVGYGAAGGSSWDFAVARYNTDGSPDTSFGGSGVVVTSLSNCESSALSVAIQADGKIVVAGFATNSVQNCYSGGGAGYNFAVVRYNPNGSLDATFNGTGKVITPINTSIATSVAIQADGKIVVAGDSYHSSRGVFTLVRYNTNGSLDTSFDNDGIVTTGVGGAFAVAIQADGKIVAAGTVVFRYNTDGSMDTTFNGTGIVTLPDSLANSVAIQADGKILTTNWFSGFNSGNRLVRYNANGTPDTSFNGTGSVAVGIYVNSAVVQADGKIVAAGYNEFGEGTAFAVIRLNGNGSLDATFGGTGTVITPIVTQVYYSSGANAIAIQPDGKIVAAGGVVDRSFDLFDFALVRYQGDSASPASCPNPIDCADFFVRQHYQDFLNRAPDAPGLAHWAGEITACDDASRRQPGESLRQCTDRKRTNTSAAFFLSPEFQYTGYYVYRLYKGSLIQNGAGRFPTNQEFLRDVSQVASGIIQNNQLSAAVIEANKKAFAEDFIKRAEFRTLYDPLSNFDYVERLFQTTGISVTANVKQALVEGLNNQTETRASVLQKVVDGTVVIAEGNQQFTTAYGRAFYQKEFNAAFVLMEYFGYLRRDPDAPGYQHWLDKLNFYGNYLDAEMVRSFILSPEYRARFGQP